MARCPRQNHRRARVGAKARAARAGRAGYGHGTHAGKGIGGELLADAANVATAFRQGNRTRVTPRPIGDGFSILILALLLPAPHIMHLDGGKTTGWALFALGGYGGGLHVKEDFDQIEYSHLI